MPNVSSTDEPTDTLTADLDHFYKLEGERTFVYRDAHKEKTKKHHPKKLVSNSHLEMEVEVFFTL